MRYIILLALLALCAPVSAGEKLLEPVLRLPVSTNGVPHVAITLDACSGDIDRRILDVLVDEKIPATLFVTERWLLRNAETVALLAAHADLFAIENHGRDHVPAVLGTEKPYGIAPAGTLVRLDDEVLGGAFAVQHAFGSRTTWFRGATALYTRDALDEIGRLGFQVAGFSLNADFGATASAKVAQARLADARDGDVVIAHINQPTRAAGAGIAAGLLDLKRKGFAFVLLSDLAP